VPRLDRLNCSRAQQLLCEGRAFVAPAEDVTGTRPLLWDWHYLQEHLPPEQKYGVMLDEGSGKIVMSHSARNGERLKDVARETDSDFRTSDQTRMTFVEFVEAAQNYKKTTGGKLPYFGLHILWRFKESDNGFLGKIDEEMTRDLWSMNFGLLKEWQEANVLPLVQRFYLFAGVGGTLYHCHYDLQPNIHVQLTGRKRFILFPPESRAHLYPFPVHHDLDRRSMIDFDLPDSARFPSWRHAHGAVVELEPGDALYIPPYWWHHVQSLTPETTSMAMWFFERFPLSAGHLYGLSSGAEDVRLSRDVEELIGGFFPDAVGEDDCTKPRPTKATDVWNFMQWMKPRTGLPPTPVNLDLLARSRCSLEEVEARVYEYLREGFPNANDEFVNGKLRSFINGRF